MTTRPELEAGRRVLQAAAAAVVVVVVVAAAVGLGADRRVRSSATGSRT